MAIVWSREYPVGDSGGSLFGVTAWDVNVVLVTITTHLNLQKVDCCIDGSNFVLSCSIHSNKEISYQ